MIQFKGQVTVPALSLAARPTITAQVDCPPSVIGYAAFYICLWAVIFQNFILQIAYYFDALDLDCAQKGNH